MRFFSRLILLRNFLHSKNGHTLIIFSLNNVELLNKDVVGVDDGLKLVEFVGEFIFGKFVKIPRIIFSRKPSLDVVNEDEAVIVAVSCFYTLGTKQIKYFSFCEIFIDKINIFPIM